MDCPICKTDNVTQLVIPEGGKLSCRSCAGEQKIRSNPNLGQTVQRWTHIDKTTGREIKHRLTSGKEWEISHRRVSQDDPKVVINTFTKKEAQY